MALKLIVIDRVKTDNVTEALRGLTNRLATDEKTIAERQWQRRKLAPANTIGEFSLWAELTRQQLVARLAIPQADETEIPF